MNHRLLRLLAVPTAALSILVVPACGGGGGDTNATGSGNDTESDAGSSSSQVDAVDEASALEIRDAWVKAADTGMSAAFGVLVNTGDEDVTIVAATSDASPIMELHETVEDPSGEMIMREKDGGFVVPAGGEYLLQPGANHLMLMEMERPVQAGEEVKFALAMDDGSSFDFAATAKDYSGANERYVESE